MAWFSQNRDRGAAEGNCWATVSPLREPRAAALPSHPGEGTRALRERGAAPVAPLTPFHPLHGPGQRCEGPGKREAHVRLQRDKAARFALLHAAVESRLACEAREGGGAATSCCQAGASQRNKQDCPGRTSSTCHPLTTCLLGGTEAPSTRGTGRRAARAQNGLPSIAGLRGDPADMELFPARLPGAGQGIIEWKRSPAVAQRSPTSTWPWPLLPPLPRWRRWPTPRSQSQDKASKAQGRFKVLKAS